MCTSTSLVTNSEDVNEQGAKFSFVTMCVTACVIFFLEKLNLTKKWNSQELYSRTFKSDNKPNTELPGMFVCTVRYHAGIKLSYMLSDGC